MKRREEERKQKDTSNDQDIGRGNTRKRRQEEESQQEDTRNDQQDTGRKNTWKKRKEKENQQDDTISSDQQDTGRSNQAREDPGSLSGESSPCNNNTKSILQMKEHLYAEVAKSTVDESHTSNDNIIISKNRLRNILHGVGAKCSTCMTRLEVVFHSKCEDVTIEVMCKVCETIVYSDGPPTVKDYVSVNYLPCRREKNGMEWRLFCLTF